MMGFGFTEKMAGTYEPLSPALRGGALHFQFEVDVPQISIKESVGRAVGHVTVEGLAKDAEAEGTLELSPFWKRRMRYRFSFTGDDGKRYRFEGQKKIRPLRRLIHSWTTLPCRIYDDGGLAVGQGTLKFDIGQLLPFLGTFRRV